MLPATRTARLRFGALLVALAIAFSVEDAWAQVPTAGTFASAPAYSTSGQAAVVFRGGTVDQLEAAARLTSAGGVWAQSPNGAFQLLVVDGPAFLRDAFKAQFPAGFSSSTAVTLVADTGSPRGPRCLPGTTRVRSRSDRSAARPGHRPPRWARIH